MKKIKEAKFVLGALICIFCYNVVIGLQGLDLSDEGLLLSAYQQFFRHPDSVATMYYIYDTLLIGSIWQSLFGYMGIIGFRILSAILLTADAYIIYLLCKPIVNGKVIFCGLAIAMVTNFYPFVFCYNQSSAFLVLLIIFFMYKSLLSNNLFYMFIAGLLTGCSIFFRFPNISFVGLAIVLWPFYIYKKNGLVVLKMLFSAIFGFVVGFFCNVLLIIALGHEQYMLNMVSVAFSLSIDDTSTHNITTMLYTYMEQYKEILCAAIQLSVFPYLFWILNNWKHLKQIHVFKKACIFSTLALLVLVSCYLGFRHGYLYLYYFYAICCMLFFYVLKDRTLYDEKIVYLAILAFAVLFLMPLGSDGGVINVGTYCLYLPITLSIGLIWDYTNKIADKRLQRICSTAIIGFGVMLFTSSLYKVTQKCYRDFGPRWTKTQQLQYSTTPTTFTSSEKAQKLDTLLYNLHPLLETKPELIVYPASPMIHYLTNTTSYVGAPWPSSIIYPLLYHLFAQAEKTKKSLPILILVKAKSFQWDIPNPNWHDVSDCQYWRPSENKKKNALIASFMIKHNYKIYYEDTYFQIQIPQPISK